VYAQHKPNSSSDSTAALDFFSRLRYPRVSRTNPPNVPVKKALYFLAIAAKPLPLTSGWYSLMTSELDLNKSPELSIQVGVLFDF
jgi:hypothetical protein